MPSSDWRPIPMIVDLVMQAAPRFILDIGIGFGKYGLLCREYTDIWQRRYARCEWQVIIEGIEPYRPYIGSLQAEIYDHIHIGPVLDVLPDLGRYDLILFIDVLEHLERDAGERALGLISEHSERAIVTTPVRMSAQGEVFGNVRERHVTQWTRPELERYGPVLEFGNTFLLQLREEAQCKSR